MNENTGHCQRRSPLVAGLLASLALAVANTSVAADVPADFINALWSLTTSPSPTTSLDAQRILKFASQHYRHGSEMPDWPDIFTLTDEFQKAAPGSDPIAELRIGLVEVVMIERPRHDVGSGQKVKVTLRHGPCIRADQIAAVIHQQASTHEGKPEFKIDTPTMRGYLDLDAPCATSLLIDRVFIPPAK